MSATKEGKEAWVEKINRYIAKIEAPVFELSLPSKHTVKLRDGSYSVRPFIGGEKFYPLNAYLGKRGDVIWVFSPHENNLYDREFAQLEVPSAKMLDSFYYFREFLNKIEDEDDDSETALIQAGAKKIENEAHARAVAETHMNDERYGSW